MRRLAVIATLLALAGCGEVPFAPPHDAGPRADAPAIADGALPGVDSGYVRPTMPTLPPADLEVTLPYGSPEVTLDLMADASVGRLDVAFSVDATGSFGGEINALQSELTGTLIPQLAAAVPDVAFSVSRFEDAPFSPFGVATDLMYTLLSPMTTDATRVAAGVAALDMPLGNGGDGPEAGYESLYQIATGTGLSVGGTTLAQAWSASRAAAGGGTTAGVGFRDGSLRVAVHVTDAASHEGVDYGTTVPGAHSSSETITALRARGVHVIGIASNDAARAQLEALALATGAEADPVGGVCHTGIGAATHAPGGDGRCLLVFDITPDGTGLSTAIVSALTAITNALTYHEAWGEAVDDRLGFVQAVEAVEATVPMGGTPPTRSDAHPSGDGVLDTFLEVRSGTTMTFRAHVANRSVEPADYDQVFRVTIRVLGDGVLLTERTVRITVPRGRLDAGLGDAGLSDGGAIDASAVDAGASDAAIDDAGMDAGLDAG